MQCDFLALDNARYRIKGAASLWQKYGLFYLIKPIWAADAFDTSKASAAVFSTVSASALKMLSSHKRLFGNSSWNLGTDFPSFAKRKMFAQISLDVHIVCRTDRGEPRFVLLAVQQFRLIVPYNALETQRFPRQYHSNQESSIVPDQLR